MPRRRKLLLVAGVVVLASGLAVMRMAQNPSPKLSVSFRGFVTNDQDEVTLSILVSNECAHPLEVSLSTYYEKHRNQEVTFYEKGDVLTPRTSRVFSATWPETALHRVRVRGANFNSGSLYDWMRYSLDHYVRRTGTEVFTLEIPE